MQIIALLYLASVSFKQKDYAKATELYQQSWLAVREIDKPEWERSVLARLGYIYARQ